MPTPRGEFIRKLGCLCIHVQRLNRSLAANEFCEIESESQATQDLVLDLIKSQRKLNKPDQRALRPRFSQRREEALQSLEMSRHIMDESHEAALTLLRAVHEAAGYGVEDSGPSVPDHRN
jgi:hypothetical protein